MANGNRATTNDEPPPQIVIRGTREDWPGGSRNLVSLGHGQRRDFPDDTMCFRARLDPGNNELRFRIAADAVHRMQEQTPRDRGTRLVDALIDWIQGNPGRELQPCNDFRVYVSDDGRDTTVGPYEP